MNVSFLRPSSKDLFEQLGSDPARYVEQRIAVLRENPASAWNVSLHEEAETLLGRHFKDVLRNPRYYEAVGVVTPASLAGYYSLGQEVMTAAMMEAYQDAVDDPVLTIPTTIPVAGPDIDGVWRAHPILTDSIDDSTVLPLTSGHIEQMAVLKVFQPPCVRKHRIIRLSEEAVMKDETSALLNQAAQVGRNARREMYLDFLRVLFGITNNYREEVGGTVSSYNTYLDAGPWANITTNTPLEDWTSLDRLEDLLAQIRHPITSRPLETVGRHMVVCRGKYRSLRRILSATELREDSPTGGQTTVFGNDWAGRLQAFAPADAFALIRDHLPSASTDDDAVQHYVFGDISKAFAKVEAENMTVQIGEPDLENRILISYHVKNWYAYWAMNPRAVVMSQFSSEA